MEKFHIEVPHEAEPKACALAVEVLRTTGSHYLTNADWGCLDGVHKAWITVEAESKQEAKMILPVPYRNKATIVQLNKFSKNEIDEILHH